MARRRRSGRAASRPRPAAVLGRVAVRLLVLALVCGGAWIAWLDLQVRSKFEGRRWQVPARIYARPLELFAGAAVDRGEVERELRAAGYHADPGLGRPASFRRAGGDTLEIRTRSFRFWDGREPEQVLRLRFSGTALASITRDGREAALGRLEPALIGRIHASHREDRVLVRLDDVPRALVAALLAVEDRDFFEHHGVSPRGIARALLANLRAGATVQGGSTLTQQLAKSYFLSAERSLWRKLNDAAIAVLLEARYGKEELLEAYLNEVYLGQDGTRAVHGFGLAARHYFDRRLDELILPEVALLAGLVRGPSLYNPRRHPERARARRDRVLAQMQQLGIIDAALAERARAAPLGITARPGASGARHPAFLDLVRRQLRRDYRDADLRSEGLRVFTTLDPGVQRAAEEALARTLEQLESEPSRAGLQGAVVVTDPQGAEVLAVVGGRHPSAGGFNRALDARRPIGSLVKPAVYLTALAQARRYTLATPLEDAPVRLEGARGEPWQPRNYDGELHGTVPLIEALARSYNLATVRLGMDLGLDAVRDTLARLGAPRSLAPYPSLLLGALDMSPVEVAGLYQTLASGGFRQPLRAIREVTDADGRPLERYGLTVEEAVDPRAAFLTVHAMREVMRSGTGRRAGARLPRALAPAGKTGTTDELRDSWFAGFAGDRLAVVWVGRDDNTSARLSGASGALRVWTRLFESMRVRPLALRAPEGIVWARIERDRHGDAVLRCLGGAGLRPAGTGATLSGALPFVAGAGVAAGCGAVAAAAPGAASRAAPRAGAAAAPRRADERGQEAP